MIGLDAVACLTHAIDVLREAFDLALATTAPNSDGLHAQRWYVQSAARRVAKAARLVHALADQTSDPRIVAASERLDMECRVVLARLRDQLRDESGDGAVCEMIVDDATGPVPICDEVPDA